MKTAGVMRCSSWGLTSEQRLLMVGPEDKGEEAVAAAAGAEWWQGGSCCAQSGSVLLHTSALRSHYLLHVLLCSSITLHTYF